MISAKVYSHWKISKRIWFRALSRPGSIRRSPRFLQPFRFKDTPIIHAAGTIRRRNGFEDDLRFQINALNPFSYQFDGWEIPFEKGSGDFSVLGGNAMNRTANGTINVQGSRVNGSKFLAPLLARLAPLGFREPLDAKLSFKLDALSLRMNSLRLVSGSQAVRLSGALYFPGGLVDLSGEVENSSVVVRGVGTVQRGLGINFTGPAVSSKVSSSGWPGIAWKLATAEYRANLRLATPD